MKTLILVALVGAAVLAACSPPPDAEEAPVRAARIEQVQPAQSAAVRDFVGRVEARLTVDLSFQVGGRLADFPVSEGEQIVQGTPVAALETQDFDRALREARVQLQQAQQNLDRQRTLHERGIASDAALEDAQTAYDLRAVALDNARQNRQYAAIEAPFDGLVSRRLVDNFTTIAPGQPVVRLQDVGELRVAIQVPESVLALVDETEPVEVTARFPFLPEESFVLEFRELESEPDPSSQTYKALFALPNDIPANILPGMSANVRVVTETTNAVVNTGVRVPVTALDAVSSGGFQVWVYDQSVGTVSARSVVVGPVNGDTALVEGGLEAGEQIVTAGIPSLYEGMAVRPLQPAVQTGAASGLF